MTKSAVRAEAKVPRACSDVFRFWVSLALGLLVASGFEIVVIVLQLTEARRVPTDEQFELEFGFGARLATWVGFAVATLRWDCAHSLDVIAPSSCGVSWQLPCPHHV